MDSITHILVGAVIGEACVGKSIGKRALVLGAVAQSLPDIDFIASLWLPPADNLLAHRGITHSFLFAAVASFLLAMLLDRKRRQDGVHFREWILFFAIELFSHVLLDAFNNYGVGWFEPFSHDRISFNALFVADPFFSIGPAIAFAVLVLLDNRKSIRIWLARIGLATAVLYLGYALLNKALIDPTVRENLQRQKIQYRRFLSTPTAFNNWLWYIVAEGNSGYYVGYRSVFDRSDSIGFHYFPRQDSLLTPIRQREDVAQLLQFSEGYFALQHYGDTLVFNDLRFGQIGGWSRPQARFVFHYYLNYPDGNALVIQRGRMVDWKKENLVSLMNRIKGK